MRNRLTDHIERLRRQFGKKLDVGNHSYKAAGYFSSNIGFNPTYEAHLMPALRRAMERSGPFVDVGVNIGQTFLKVLEIDPEREYIGFEPQLGACSQVARFISDNGLSHMRVLPLGLADEDRLTAFHASGDFDPMASMVDERGTSSFIQVRNGDALLKELSVTPAVIKIDVEGAELMVFKGLSETLDQKPTVFFEQLPNFVGFDRQMLPKPMRDQRDAAAAEIFAFLTRKGFTIHQITKDGSERPVDGFSLNDPENYEGPDYVAK